MRGRFGVERAHGAVPARPRAGPRQRRGRAGLRGHLRAAAVREAGRRRRQRELLQGIIEFNPDETIPIEFDIPKDNQIYIFEKII